MAVNISTYSLHIFSIFALQIDYLVLPILYSATIPKLFFLSLLPSIINALSIDLSCACN